MQIIKQWIPAIIIAIVIIGLASYVTIRLTKAGFLSILDERATITEHQFTLLTDNIAQSETHFLQSQDELQSRMREIFDQFDIVYEQLESLDLEPTIITTTTGTVQGDTIIVSIDGLEQIPREFVFRTSEGMPVAYYIIDEDSVSGEVEMTTGTYDLVVRLNTVVAIDDSQSPAILTEATISSSGDLEPMTYPIPLDNSVSYFTTSDAVEMDWWDPHLDIGATIGVQIPSVELNAAGTLGVSIMSYGTDQNSILRFIRLGGFLSQDGVGVGISPVLYNLGDTIPFLSDTWIGPSVGYEFSDMEWDVGLVITSTL